MKHLYRYLVIGLLYSAFWHTAHAGTISSLPAASTLDGTEVLPVDQGVTPVTKKALVSDVSDYVKTIIRPTGGNGTVQWQFGSGTSATFSGDPEFLYDFSSNILTVGSTSTAGTVRGGSGSPSTDGAQITVIGGPAGATNVGGAVRIMGADGGATSGNGGPVTVVGGTATDGNGGAVSLTGGAAATTTSANRSGGSVLLTGGASTGSNSGGGFILNGGAGGDTGNGGQVNLTGGSGGATSGNGGGVIVNAGVPGASGNGGSVNLNGRAGVGTAKNGGNVSLTAGAASDASGVSGSIMMNSWQADTSYDYQTPATGFSITLGDLKGVTILDPAGTLATGTITLPAKPGNGQLIRVATSQTITSLTVSPNSGQSIKNAPTTLSAGTGFLYIYRSTGTTWFRLQ
jgi:hypothetical protein